MDSLEKTSIDKKMVEIFKLRYKDMDEEGEDAIVENSNRNIKMD